MTAAVIGLSFVVAILAVLVVGLLRSHAEVLRSLHDLGVTVDASDGRLRRAGAGQRAGRRDVDHDGGAWPPAEAGLGPAHDITGITPDGAAVHLAVASVDHDTVLAFLTTGCATCAAFWDALGGAGAEDSAGDRTRVIVVTMGPEEESESAVHELAPDQIATVMSTRAWVDYNVPASPFFLLVDGASSSVVGEGSGQSWDQVLRLLQRSVADSSSATRRTRRELLRGASPGRAVADRIGAAPPDEDVEVAP